MTVDGTSATMRDLLTPRQREAMVFVAEGLTNVEVAEAMYVSLSTVKTVMKHIVQRVSGDESTTRTALAARWLREEHAVEMRDAVTLAERVIALADTYERLADSPGHTQQESGVLREVATNFRDVVATSGEAVPATRWECGPHSSVHGGHDARCRQAPANEVDR